MKGCDLAITRSSIETEVISELGPLLTLAAKSTLTNGANPDLNGPLAFSLQALGITPNDPTNVSDADCAAITNAQYTVICQLVAYYALKKCLDSLCIPNEKAQDRDQEWNEMVRRFTQQMMFLQAQYASLLNIVYQPVQSAAYETRFPTPRHLRHWALGHGRVDH